MPVQVEEIGEGIQLRDIACGKTHMVAVATDGTLYAWGDNRCAQLGFASSGGGSSSMASTGPPSNNPPYTPVMLPSLSLSMRPIHSAPTSTPQGNMNGGGLHAPSSSSAFNTASSSSSSSSLSYNYSTLPSPSTLQGTIGGVISSNPLSGVFSSSTPAPFSQPTTANALPSLLLNGMIRRIQSLTPSFSPSFPPSLTPPPLSSSPHPIASFR